VVLPENWTPDLQARLEGLKQRFLEGLPERLRDIENAQSAEELARLLHNMAGAAGAYGLPDVSQLARQAEQARLSGLPSQWQSRYEALREAILKHTSHPAA